MDQSPINAVGAQDLLERSMDNLGFGELLAALAQRAESDPGRRLAETPSLAETAPAAEIALTETAQMVRLFESGDPPPAAPIQDVGTLVRTAQAQGILEPIDLVKISDLLGFAAAAFTYYASHPEAERLREWAQRLDDAPDLHRSLVRSIDRDGSVLDTASPTLKSLRSKHRTLKDRIMRRLNEIVARDPDSILQDSFYTQRAQRYVVPVRAAAKSRIDGIVHDSSSSGQTVFVEPTELVEPNNRIKLIEAEVDAEVRRILKELCGRVASEGDAILTDEKVLAHLDLVRARARLALDLDATRPVLNGQGRVRLRKARHPLLALRGHRVVDNDLDLDGEASVLLISGPNAGGKSVGLSMLGLMALMARAGLFVPAEAGSELAIFEEVFAVIGDDQDLSRDLSSFSAHMIDIIGILGSAGERSLVLMDELMNSTDPEEGAALAAVVLCALRDQGCRVMATTHLPSLKGFAHEERGFVNAGYAFDPENFTPTYRLITGVPGQSLGIDVAARLGLSQDMVERARAELASESRRMESLLHELAERLAAQERAEAELYGEQVRARALAREYEALRDQAAAHERELRGRVRTEAREALRRVEDELGLIMGEVRELGKDVGRAVILRARERVREVDERVSHDYSGDASAGEPADWSRLKKGDKVRVMPLLVEAELLTAPGPKVRGEEMVSVRIGKLRVKVEAAKVRMAPAPEEEKVELKKKAPRPQEKPKPRRRPSGPPPADPDDTRPEMVQTSRNTLDLRGQRYYEAEARLERFLDDACRERLANIFIIHGHGTGALKQMVREQVGSSPYVSSFRPGAQGEGGDGVTVAMLKDLSFG